MVAAPTNRSHPTRPHTALAALAFALAAAGCVVSSSPRGTGGGPPPPRGGYGGPGQAQPGPQAPAGAPEAVVQAAVQAAMRNDFQAYLALVHSQEKENARQVAGIEQFSWKRFVGQASWYLDGGGSVQVARRAQEGQDLMLYMQDFKNAGRMPPPMRLRPDQGGWRIVTNSL